MSEKVVATKGNLISIKKSLALANLGYELLDKKRNVLIRELMGFVEKAKQLCVSIDEMYIKAYSALQMANISQGIVENVANSIPIDNSINISYRSVMGCELPKLTIEIKKPILNYGLQYTNSNVDMAYICFEKVKYMTLELVEVENSIYRLTSSIKKTQTRANALQNIIIPKYKENLNYIINSLDEKEREEFSRMKVIKANKNRKKYIVK